MRVFQNIQTKQKGFCCPIRVLNHSGDDILTTFDPKVDNSVAVATKDLQDFWQQCITEFEDKGLQSKPHVFGKRFGKSAFDKIAVDSPDFRLDEFEDILIQPVPLSGG